MRVWAYGPEQDQAEKIGGKEVMGHMETNNLLGQVLGERYRIDELVGQGSRSVVYKAYDTNMHRGVAVKVILTGLGEDARFRTTFENKQQP